MLFRLVKLWFVIISASCSSSLYACRELVIRISKLLLFSLYLLSFVASTAAYASEKTILIYGDSLSAAYGIPKQQGWVSLLSEKLQREKLAYKVINASISGETTDGGRSRIDNVLRNTQPKIVVLELGANDGLRGLSVTNMQKNLESIINICKKSGAKVLLVGMKIPPNYGKKYTDDFSDAYIKLAKQHKVPLVPFMLENVAANPDLIQQDGLHPNTAAQPIILNNIWSKLYKLIKK